LKRRRV
jgi:hypothetical protein